MQNKLTAIDITSRTPSDGSRLVYSETKQFTRLVSRVYTLTYRDMRARCNAESNSNFAVRFGVGRKR